ncbi:HlyD family secretion protein [Elusimicrobium posterum]|uniref:HlyD family secretion protein n=1 Tax=Elusimicrobium posterum TaxID=3116653 RepID=UPI003C706B7A
MNFDLAKYKNKLIVAALIIIAFTAFMVLRPKYIMLHGEVVIRQISISPKVTGRISEVAVTEGDFVKKGDLVAKIDSPEVLAKVEQATAASAAAQAQYNKAQAGARTEDITAAYNTYQKAVVGEDLAKKTYNRVQELFEGGVISQQKLDEAHASYNAAIKDKNAAKSRYDMAVTGTREEDKDAALAVKKQALGVVAEVESYLNETTIIAPRDGEISSVIVEQGELVSAGFAVATLLDLDDVWLTFSVREDLLKNIKMGQTIKVTIPALGKKKYDFEVTYISKMGDFAVWSATKTRGEFDLKTFEVRAKSKEPVEGLRQGMSALFKTQK